MDSQKSLTPSFLDPQDASIPMLGFHENAYKKSHVQTGPHFLSFLVFLGAGKKNTNKEKLAPRKRKGKKNYNSKREDIEEEDQREDEGNVIL